MHFNGAKSTSLDTVVVKTQNCLSSHGGFLTKVTVTPYRIALRDSKILCPFVSVCMRFLSVPHAVNAFRVRLYPFCPILSVGKFWTCSKLRTDATG